ncbi:MAG: phosphatase PAP2 family protein [Patescibacteria group bacterium]
MDFIDALKSLDHLLFFSINGLAGTSALLDMAGIFAAKALIWVMGFAAVLLLLFPGSRAPEEAIIAPPRRTWFFPSGTPRAPRTIFIIDGKKVLRGVWAIAATALSVGLGGGVRMILAQIFGRTRPYLYEGVKNLFTTGVADYAFPSGHTTVAFALAFSLLFYYPKYGVLFLFSALLVGLGRIYIGAHYPADVAAGMILGYGAAIVAREIIKVIQKTIK